MLQNEPRYLGLFLVPLRTAIAHPCVWPNDRQSIEKPYGVCLADLLASFQLVLGRSPQLSDGVPAGGLPDQTGLWSCLWGIVFMGNRCGRPSPLGWYHSWTGGPAWAV